ncbi:cystathionine gamma-lyase isoform X2 [Brevipalpus obovatus]|uniref:cystathionine gamma-lyase isoform X2 n=1 Tax=Brevipalpus obovatus TaxID=246614 RepID=UPI003D9DF6A3
MENGFDAHVANLHIATRLVHVGQDPLQWTNREVIPPIVCSTTFQQPSPGKPSHDYSRGGNPTRNCLEKCLASLDNAKFAYCFSSGLAALNTITYLLLSGDHIICGQEVYGGTLRLFTRAASLMGIKTSFVDIRNVKNIKAALKPETKLIWIETPSNPTLQLADIRAIADLIEQEKRDPKIILAVDNTFMTPILQKPLDLGADLVMYSMTKYMNGHSDLLMGAIVANNEEMAQKISFFQMSLGAVPSAFDCFLANRGLKTLHLRMERHQESALKVAQFLEAHPKVVKVHHPGLKSHPQFELGKRQTSGSTGMLSFDLKGSGDQASEFLKSLKIFSLAESLGGVESLAEIPSIMTHASIPLEERLKLGITDTLIRLSIGVEHVDDLIADLEQAFKKVA